MEICYPITNSSSLTTRMEERYAKKRSIALAADSQEGTPRELWNDEYVQARYAGLTSDRSDRNYDI